MARTGVILENVDIIVEEGKVVTKKFIFLNISIGVFRLIIYNTRNEDDGSIPLLLELESFYFTSFSMKMKLIN